MKVITKTVSMNRNTYTLRVIEGAMFFSVRISTTGANRHLYTPKIQAAIIAAIVEADHAEALAINEEIDAIVEFSADRAPVQMDGDMNWVFEAAVAVWNARQVKEPSAQDQAITQTLARQNSLSHKIGLAFAGAALVFSSLAAPVQAEVVPSYPVDASRMSLEGSVAVSIDCSTLTVDVIRESNNAGYFSKQVKKQVANICYGEKGTLDRVYVFKMNKRVGAHDMMVNNTGRWTL